MTFLEAVVAIRNSSDLKLCDCESELSGVYPSICVYDNDGMFIGKLRWPDRDEYKISAVDQSVVDTLNKK